MHINKISLFLIIFIFSGVLSYAQTNDAETPDENTADVAITAKVTAKELKFEVVPSPKVEFFGKPERKTEWSSERKNLPASVEPNVIYRDIGITLKIVSVFADIDKIVDDALGIAPPGTTETAEKTDQSAENKPVAKKSPTAGKKTEPSKSPKN